MKKLVSFTILVDQDDDEQAVQIAAAHMIEQIFDGGSLNFLILDQEFQPTTAGTINLLPITQPADATTH